VKLVLSALLSLACFGCAVSREEAVANAKAELARRHLPLPTNYIVEAERGKAIVEGEGRTYEVYGVDFMAPGAKRPKLLYRVNVELTGKIDDVADVRNSIPF
jgi:hypothetical protein